jgi:hypothetical protein
MSSRPKANITKKTPAPLVEQTALAMVKQLVEQGRAKEVYRVLREHPAGRAVLKEKHPGPKNVIAVLSGFTDSAIDNTYGYIVEDGDSDWLFKLFEHIDASMPGLDAQEDSNRCRLGGVLLHCEEQESVIETLTGAIQDLDSEDFNHVVRVSLGIRIEEDVDEDEDEEDGDAEGDFDRVDWVENHGEELGNALIEKLNHLVDDRVLASQADVDEVMQPKTGVRVRGTIIVDANSWE